MLQQSSRLPLADHEGIAKLVKLANIFHLLPSAANIFLDNLVNAIVQTEAQMHFSTRSPFSEPLAKYLDRYPVEGIEFFMRHLKFPQHLRTLRSILLGRYAPNLERELASRTPLLVNLCTQGNDTSILTQVLLLFHDLAEICSTWISDYELAIDTLIKVWRSPNVQHSAPDQIQRHSLLLGIFMKALQQSPRIDLLFDVVAIFNRNLGMDVIHISQFLYKHVALSQDTIFRRNVLLRFLTWFGDSTVPWNQKGAFLRYIVTPTLLVHASRGSSNERLLDGDYIDQLHRLIWQPITETVAFGDTDDMFMIELLHFTTILVHHYSGLLEDVKKDIIKCAWHFITNNDDIIVKQTAYLLAARFFAAFPTPQKFILRAWTGLLRLSHSEGKPLVRQEALATLAPVLPQSDSSEPGHPQWAKTTRRLLAEEGLAQMIAIYHLIIKQPQLFYPVRSLFVPHMANSLSKLGMSASSTPEMRSLSIEILQVIFDWEEQVTQASQENRGDPVWLTPIGLRENMISYLVRLTTFPHEATAKTTLVPRALSLLQSMVGPNGWTEVTVGLRYFSRTLEQVCWLILALGVSLKLSLRTNYQLMPPYHSQSHPQKSFK
jgi:transformation/transcription domain-associated protein